MVSETREVVFQDKIIQQLLANGWLLGKPEEYNRELASMKRICLACRT